jgi:polysaccharide pyruvyl transferase WcaK-like protein
LKERFAIIAPKGQGKSGVEKSMREWLCTLRAEGVRLLFVPLFTRQDTTLCRSLCAHPNDQLAEGLSASDLVGLTAHACVVCGMRLHALIFAASVNTPFVGFGTEPKIEAFCRENGGLYYTDLYR